MCDWDWEPFDWFINAGKFTFSDPGPLHGPIHKFTIKRDADLKFILETISGQDAISNAISYPPGTVRSNVADVATLSDIWGGTTVTLSGVQPLKQARNLNIDPLLGELNEQSSIYAMSGVTSNKGEPKYIIDWLANVRHFIWPDTTDDEIVTTRVLTIKNGGDGPIFTHSSKESSVSRNCVKFTVDGYEIYLSTSTSQSEKEINNPAFLLYIGSPTEEFRERIRTCLSFSLGSYIVHLGHSTFCKDFGLISFEAISAYALDGRAFEIATAPPAPLGTKYEGEIDRAILSRMVNSFYHHYDALNFLYLNWAFWHAVCATPHIAPVHFGAALEALQRVYVKNNPTNYQTALLERGDWRTLQCSAEAAIASMQIADGTKQVLINKISGLNRKPQSVLLDEVLSAIGLNLSEMEKTAWKRRNEAGHGIHAKPGEHVRLIIYYDYYTINRPVRKLFDPIP